MYKENGEQRMLFHYNEDYQQISECGRHYRNKICENKAKWKYWKQFLKFVSQINEKEMGREKKEREWESEEKQIRKLQFKYFKALLKMYLWNAWNLNTDTQYWIVWKHWHIILDELIILWPLFLNYLSFRDKYLMIWKKMLMSSSFHK